MTACEPISPVAFDGYRRQPIFSITPRIISRRKLIRDRHRGYVKDSAKSIGSVTRVAEQTLRQFHCHCKRRLDLDTSGCV